MEGGVDWKSAFSFGKKPEVPAPTVGPELRTDSIVRTEEQQKNFETSQQLERAAAAETAATAANIGVGVGVAAAAAFGVAAGPAMPIVAGVAVLAAIGAKMYAQNKKLARLFERAATISKEIEFLLAQITTAVDNAPSQKAILEPNITDVKYTAAEIQDTIGRLAGADTYKRIQAMRAAGLDPTRQTWGSKLGRLRRMLSAGETINTFREQVLFLSLSFSILQSKFAMILSVPGFEAAAKAAMEVKPLTDEETAKTANLELAGKSAAETDVPPPQGGTTYRRRSKRPIRRTKRTKQSPY